MAARMHHHCDSTRIVHYDECHWTWLDRVTETDHHHVSSHTHSVSHPGQQTTERAWVGIKIPKLYQASSMLGVVKGLASNGCWAIS
jgi:hypothetical protein